MLLELLVLLASGLLVAIAGIAVLKMITCRLALIKFKKRTKGLPVLPEASLLANHTVSMILRHNSCQWLVENHKKMGKYVGMLMSDRMFIISTTDLDLVKTIIVDEGDQHLDRMRAKLPLDEYEHSIMLAPPDEWRRARRVVAPALKSNRFKAPNVVSEIEDSIGKLIGHIERRLIANNNQPSEFEVDDFVHKYSLDLVFSCFYKQYNEIDFDDPECQWPKLIDDGLEKFHTSLFVKLSMIFPKLRGVVDWLVWNFDSQGLTRRRVLEFVKLQTKLGLEARKQLEERQRTDSHGDEIDKTNIVLKDGTKFRRNLIDYVVDQFLDGKITKREYFNNSCFMVAAADKTAADSIVHTIYQLSIRQDVQEKLRASIKADGTDSEYLDWVLRESLRLMPPANIGCSRTVTRDFPTDDGKVIPAGSLVITCAFVIHRLKEYWGEDADEFRPERWSDTSHHHPMQFLSFGAGQRGCPGREFAMFEMKMLFASLLTRYKFQGQPRDDVYSFSTPLLIFILPDSLTKVIISRLENDC